MKARPQPVRASRLNLRVAGLAGCFALVLAAPDQAQQYEPGGKETVELEGCYSVIIADQVPPQLAASEAPLAETAEFAFLQTDDLTFYELMGGAASLSGGAIASPGDRIRVQGATVQTEMMSNGLERHVLQPGTIEILEPAPQTVSQAQQVAVLLVNFTDDRRSRFSRADVQQAYFGSGGSAAARVQEFSYGIASIGGTVFSETPTEYYELDVDAPDHQGECFALDQLAIDAAGTDVDWLDGSGNQNFDRLAVLFPFTFDPEDPLNARCGWSGYASPNPRLLQTWEGPVELYVNWIMDSIDVSLLVHEQLHSYGHGHANAMLCPEGSYRDCEEAPNGNWNDVMGKGTGQPNAAQMRNAGWLGGSSLRTVTEDGIYRLSFIDGGSSGVKALVLPWGNNFFYHVEARSVTAGVVGRPGGGSDPDRAGPALNFNVAKTGRFEDSFLARHAHLDPETPPGNVAVNESVYDPDAGFRVTPIAADASGMDVLVELIELGPDLSVPAIDASPRDPQPGAAFSISATVSNEGSAAAGASYARFYRSSNSTISANDTEIGSVALAALAAGGETTVSFTASAPTGTLQSFWVGACADPVAGEVVTANNCSQGVEIVPEAPDLDVNATPYYAVPFKVGLSASWDPYPGAAQYRVTHFRQDACGSASVTTTTTATSSGSGTHFNCGAPDSCYQKQVTVEALDSQDNVLDVDSDSLCKVGPAPPLNLTVEPYYQSNYRVGLRACWDAVANAVEYEVTHFRQDACGQASVTVTTTDTCSGSGAHQNCGAPGSCYFKKATVKAVSAQGTVFVTESDSFCDPGQP